MGVALWRSGRSRWGGSTERTYGYHVETPNDEEKPRSDLWKEFTVMRQDLSADPALSASLLGLTPHLFPSNWHRIHLTPDQVYLIEMGMEGGRRRRRRESTYKAWNTPREPRPCAGPRIGRYSSNNLFGMPISDIVRTRHSSTTPSVYGRISHTVPQVYESRSGAVPNPSGRRAI